LSTGNDVETLVELMELIVSYEVVYKELDLG
jgi:hypothetical protein